MRHKDSHIKHNTPSHKQGKNAKQHTKAQTKDQTKKGFTKERFNITKGRYKGMNLSFESNETTRPTKALVKKSFLDTMQYRIHNAIFVECFAGSGQIGFEALSLGAKTTLFFEIDSTAFLNLKNNIEAFWEKHTRYHTAPHCLPNTQDSQYGAQDISTQDSHTTQSMLTPLGIQAYQRDCLQSCSFLESCIVDSQVNFGKNADFWVKNAIMPIFQTHENEAILYFDPPFSCRVGFEDIYERITRFVESFHESLVAKIAMIVIEGMSAATLSTQMGAFHLEKKSKFGQTTLMYFVK